MTPSHNLPFDLPAAIEAQRQELLTKLQLQGVAPEERTSAADSIESDPDVWRRAVIPRWYGKPDGFFHREAWQKIWAVTDDPRVAPAPLLLPWFRYAGKSSVIRGGAVALAARRRRRFFLYFGAVQESADKHVVNIARMLQTQEMARYYPDLANPMLSQVTGAQVSWSRQQIVTRGGVVFVALGLESAARGINWEEIRPDVVILDDLDKLRDSVQVVNNKVEVLGSDIFPAGQENTWIVFAQNVIHSQSAMRRTLDGTSGILIDHEHIGPVPAVYGLDYEKRIDKESGKARFFITAGRASWPEGFPLEQAEVKLNQSGPLRFEREYQHNVDILPSGAIYPGYNPLVHIVTYSELAAAFARQGVHLLDGQGRLRIPFHYNKAMGLDFGTTDEHPTAIKWVTTPPELEPFGPTEKRAGLVIWYRERTLPKYPHLPGEKQEPVSPLRLARIIRDAEGPAREAYGMKLRVMSHEQSAARNAFNYDFDEQTEAETLPTEFKGLGFVKVKPDRWGGISTMQNFFEVDYSQPNQFRRYPDGYKILDPNSGELVDMSGESLPGRVRMIFAVADGQGELYVDDTGALKVTSATDDAGMIRSRAERMQYTEKVNVSGDSSRFPNDFFNDQCLGAGTLIETDRGSVPIEQVTATDRVLTREGYHACSGAYLTNLAAEVQTLLFSDGRTLTGTGNHPIWCEDASEFIPMDTLRYGATMRTCREHQSSRARSSSSTASVSTVILNPKSHRTETISSPTTTSASRASARSMRRYGRRRTAPFPMGATFIISTSIPSITIFPILNASHPLSIDSATEGDRSARSSEHISPISSPVLPSGIAAMRGGRGIENTPQRYGKIDNPLSKRASTAGLSTKRWAEETKANSVRQIASSAPDTPAAQITPPDRASDAGQRSFVINTVRNESSAPIRVVLRIVETDRQPTYNLTVEGQSEYFANGILVHNCDAERMVPAKAIEAGILFVAAALAPEDVRHEHEVARVQPGLTAKALAARSPGAREGALVARMMLDRYLQREREERDAAGSAIGSMYEERRR